MESKVQKELDELYRQCIFVVKDENQANYLANEIGEDYYEKAGRLVEASRQYSSYKFTNYISLLKYVLKFTKTENLLEEFLALPSRQQELILKSRILNSIDHPSAYFTALRLAGSPKPIVLDPTLGYFSDLPEFFKAINAVNPEKSYSTDINISNAYLSTPFKSALFDFVARVPKKDFNMDYSWPCTIIILLWTVYHESILTPALEKCLNENETSDFKPLLKLLENYNEMKDYPMIWIKELS